MKLKHVKELARQAGMNLEIRLTSKDGRRVASLESSSQMHLEATVGENIWNNKELRAVNALLDYIQGARSLPPQKAIAEKEKIVYRDKPEAPADGEAAMKAIGYELTYQDGTGADMEEARYEQQYGDGSMAAIWVNNDKHKTAVKFINGESAAFTAKEIQAVGEVFREAGYETR